MAGWIISLGLISLVYISIWICYLLSEEEDMGKKLRTADGFPIRVGMTLYDPFMLPIKILIVKEFNKKNPWITVQERGKPINEQQLIANCLYADLGVAQKRAKVTEDKRKEFRIDAPKTPEINILPTRYQEKQPAIRKYRGKIVEFKDGQRFVIVD